MKPKFWRVTWQNSPDGSIRAGVADIPQRAQARGLFMIRKGQNCAPTIEPIF